MDKQELLNSLEEWKKYRKSQNHELQYYQLAEVINLVEQLDESEENLASTIKLLTNLEPDDFLKELKLCRLAKEPQKVKVPAFVAPFIEKLKITNRRYGVELEKAYNNGEDEELVNWLWFNENVLTLFRALENGYEVEEEPLFYIRLTIPSSSVVGLYLGFNKDGIFDHSYGKPHVTWDWKCTFTEHEIKSIDERYWPFAVPVEKV